jgi:thymidylate synthase ThyX
MIEADPFVPAQFGKNQKGMQADELLDEAATEIARASWLEACEKAVRYAKQLSMHGVHKQLANRLLEPFAWHTVLVTATEWDNFFNLRCHRNAQPEIRTVAELMRELYRTSKPSAMPAGYYHQPYVTADDISGSLDYSQEQWNLISAGRCARLSYLTHDGKREPEADIKLANGLKVNGHVSPFEHVARPMMRPGDLPMVSTRQYERAIADVDFCEPEFCGNFRGWVQMRREIPNEACWVDL